MKTLAYLCALSVASPAFASLVNISNGGIIHEPPPADIGLPDHQQSNLHQGFNEVQNITLTAPLSIFNPATNSNTVLAVGTVISSHMLIHDPVQNNTAEAIYTFDANILGVIFSDEALFNTHTLLGRPGVSYPASNVSAYGFETTESIALVLPNQLRFHSEAASPGDRFRVITPSPSTLIPLLVAAAIRRRRTPR